MKAVGYHTCLPVTDANALLDIELAKPVPRGSDILVRVEAVSVNPLDTKIRSRVSPDAGAYIILGWDAVGVVEAVGEKVSLFKPGDQVWYAGAFNRPGSNAEFQLVDERIVARAPPSLSSVQAAALPLTSITAWELLFDRLALGERSRGSLLIIGAAGGVGSIMIQLAKRLTSLSVIATASRAETRQWVTSLGADHVLDHSHPLKPQLDSLGIRHAEYVAGLTHTIDHITDIAEIVAPQGRLGIIDDPKSLDIMLFKQKSISIHWEFMFTRSLFETQDMLQQRKLLARVAAMVDRGEIKTTALNNFGKINAANLLKAHALLESGKSMGKIVLAGF